MIDAQLGPPVVAASRGGSVPSGGAGGDSATAARVETDDGGFATALEDRTAPAHPDAPTEGHTHSEAAGPQPGELHEEVAAEAGDSPQTTVVAQAAAGPDAVAVAQVAAAAIAAIVSAAVPTAAPTGAAPTLQATAAAGQQAVLSVQAGLPQPLAGLVPATLDADGAVVPVLAAATTLAPGTLPAPTQGQGAPRDGSVGAPGPALIAPPGQDAPPPASAPAATLTLTLTSAAQAAAAAQELTGAPQPGASAPTLTPTPLAAGDAAKPAPVVAAPTQDPAPATARAADLPSGIVAASPAPPAPPQIDSLGGIVRSGGGLTTPHELARELGTRVHMAVREGGRELVLNLRPADLGHLTIRVTMNDGVLQAQIIADRPEAARMLQQSLGQLGTALGDLGYSLDNLDVAYGGQAPRDAHAPSPGAGAAPVRGEVLDADGTPADSGTPSAVATGSPSRLDLFA